MLNTQQKAAVSRIVNTGYPHAPYVVFGPPGTGKTLTLVEAVAQLLQTRAVILVCAPSNQACDVIIERLATYDALSDMNILRLNAIQRNVEEVSDIVRRYCVVRGGVFESLDGILLKNYSLIVCTCIFAGVLAELNLKGHFTHIIVDEAGHGLEPEILVPISLKGPKTQVTIAGDPFQLGPTVRSNVSRVNGLEKSFLERLCELPLYSRYPEDEKTPKEIVGNNYHNPEFVTKLTRNYRSHPAILRLPNELFYHGDLLESADPRITNNMLNCKLLPSVKSKKQPFPIMFHGVRGEDTREGSSPSFYNPIEATIINKWIGALLDDTTLEPRVTLHDIGVITPFRKQVQKIRTLLSGRGKEAVKVGSVEDFQGQERRIVIVSAVRSNQTFVDFDQKHKLGLLENPKRFNVAVTRAQSMLIVVGNPDILASDPHWAQLIRYCVQNNSYEGVELPDYILNPPQPTPTSTSTTTSPNEQKDGKLDSIETKIEEEDSKDHIKDEAMGDLDIRGNSSDTENKEKEPGTGVTEEDEEEEVVEDVKQEDEETDPNVEDRDVDQELDIGSVITGQEGPEWRGAF